MPQGPANYTGTHSYDAQAIANYEMGQHGTAAPAGNPEFQRVGGVYVGTPTAAASGADVVMWLDAYGRNLPNLPKYLLLSTATAGTQTTTVAGTLNGIGGMKAIGVMVDVTSTVGSTATLQIFVDSRLDGTLWTNLGKFDLFTTAARSVMMLNKIDADSGIVNTLGVDAGAGTVRQVGYGDDLRVRYTISGPTSQFNFTVFVNGIG
mgnify:CR=1 FL=1